MSESRHHQRNKKTLVPAGAASEGAMDDGSPIPNVKKYKQGTEFILILLADSKIILYFWVHPNYIFAVTLLKICQQEYILRLSCRKIV